MHCGIHCNTIHSSQDMGRDTLNVYPQRNGKDDVVHIHSGILLNHKKEQMGTSLLALVVKTPGFHCRGHGFDPWLGC